MKELFRSREMDQLSGKRDYLRDHRRPSKPFLLYPIKPKDKQRIQGAINNNRRQRSIHRHPRKTRGAQDRI